jgi:hypothetical protein
MSLIDASSEAKKLHLLPHQKEAQLAWALTVDGARLEAILDSDLQMEATTDIVGTIETMELDTKADIETAYHPLRLKKSEGQHGEETTGHQGCHPDRRPLITTMEVAIAQTVIDLARMSLIDRPEAGEVVQTWTRTFLATDLTVGEEMTGGDEMIAMTVGTTSIEGNGIVTEG